MQKYTDNVETFSLGRIQVYRKETPNNYQSVSDVFFQRIKS